MKGAFCGKLASEMRLFNPRSHGDAPLLRSKRRMLTGHLFLRAKNNGGSMWPCVLIGRDTRLGSSSINAATSSIFFRFIAMSILLKQGRGGGDVAADTLLTPRGVEGGDFEGGV
jgi:hypothetical protein